MTAGERPDVPARGGRRRRAVLGVLLVGVLVMVAFDAWYTLMLGVALMLGAVVAGVATIAEPGFLDHDAPEDPPRP